jgi:hypothetical protein
MLSNHDHIYASWVSHIGNTSEKNAVVRALLDCFPASELVSIVNKGLTTLEVANIAYKKKYKVSTPFMGVEVYAQDEANFCKQHDI